MNDGKEFFGDLVASVFIIIGILTTLIFIASVCGLYD